MRIKNYILNILFLIFTVQGFSQTWENYFTFNEGTGDPFLLKHLGRYYLYTTSANVKCWSSVDLINWTYEGTCASLSQAPYAPEVIYENGEFYLYTSLNGNGHYIYKSDSPTGPFEVITENLGHSIDGTVFKDDDGSLYFYHAGLEGIYGHSMSSITDIGNDILLDAYMNEWTEGPCVFKRNGIYYMTYTGNHFLSNGYRIDYAKSETGPISDFEPAESQNPLIINTIGDFVGLGHGAVFRGPDLESYYTTYHNLYSTGSGYARYFNYDRLAFNGDKMIVYGETDYTQQNPLMPDFYDYFEREEIGSSWSTPNGGEWVIEDSVLYQKTNNDMEETWYKIISEESTGDDFTAEFNVKEIEQTNTNGRYGAVFSYTDEQNFGIALLHSQTNQLEVNFVINGSWDTPEYVELLGVENYDAWHCIRVEKNDETYLFYVDGMKKATLTNSLPAGKIGYLTSWTHAAMSYTAFSNNVDGSGIYNIYKPIPGTLEAIHFNNEGEGVSYYVTTPTNEIKGYPRSDEVNIVACNREGFSVGPMETGEWLKYNINVKDSALYNVGITYASVSAGAKIKISLEDAEYSVEINLPATGGNNTYRTVVLKDLTLLSGFQQIKVEAVSGDFNLYTLEFVYADNEDFEVSRDFSSAEDTIYTYSDGNWELSDEEELFLRGYGKRTFGSSYWRNYTVETDIQCIQNVNAGILLRANNSALGSDGTSTSLGTDFLQGYFVGISRTAVTLGKQNYNWKSLKSSSGTYLLDAWYHLKAVISGDNIKVYVDDMETPVINYTDTISFINGYPGLRSCNTNVLYDNFTISSDTSTSYTTSLMQTNPDDNIRIYPNPAHYTVTLYMPDNALRKIDIINMDGTKVYSTRTSSDQVSLNLENINQGIYLVNIREGESFYTQKLVIY